jgi:hypothetical protein
MMGLPPMFMQTELCHNNAPEGIAIAMRGVGDILKDFYGAVSMTVPLPSPSAGFEELAMPLFDSLYNFAALAHTRPRGG